MKLKIKLPLILSGLLVGISLTLSVIYYIYESKFTSRHLKMFEQNQIEHLKENTREKTNIVYQLLKTNIKTNFNSLEDIELKDQRAKLKLLSSVTADNKYQEIEICTFDEPYKIILSTNNPKIEGNAQLVILPDTKENKYSKYHKIVNDNGESFFEYNLKNENNETEHYICYLKLLPEKDWIISTISKSEFIKPIINSEKERLTSELRWSAFLFLLAGVFISFVLAFFMYRYLSKHTSALEQLAQNMVQFSKGEKPKPVDYTEKNEIGILKSSSDLLVENFQRYIDFSLQMEKGDLNQEFYTFDKNDILGTRLNNLKDSLVNATLQEEARKKEISQRNWANEGFALFSDILRRDQDKIDLLAYEAVSNMVQYVKAHQGTIFIYDDNKKVLNLAAAYASERNKYMIKQVKLREGMVGACAAEMNTLHYKKIPEDYLSITSGLGNTQPKELLLVPLLLDNTLFGVIEIATLNRFKKEEIEFVERVSNSIASTLNSVKINQNTKQFLEQAKIETELRVAQEEELRQNIEELRAIKELGDREKRDKIEEQQEKPKVNVDSDDNEEGIELF